MYFRYLFLCCPTLSITQSKLRDCKFGDHISNYINEWEGSFKVNHESVFPLGFIVPDRNVTVIIYKTMIYQSELKTIRTYTMLAFANEKLIFWGYPEDYLKNSDEDIRKIGEVASDIIVQQIIK